MSLVYITFHGENIRNIENKSVANENHKFPKHVSIYRRTVQDEVLHQIDQQGTKIISASNKYSHKSMGYAETPLDKPSKFLKKNGGIKWQKVKDHVCSPARNLPPVPKKGDILLKEKFQNINFVKKNIKRIKTAVPPNRPVKYVDTVTGEKHKLDGTGLVPKHVLSKNYGKLPNYLKGISQKSDAQICCKYMQQKDNIDEITVLCDSDRNAILMGLRANHSELEKTYQLLPLFTDTNSKKQRKAKLEQKLRMLEQDILMVQSNPVILVCKD